jgi:TonB family protein
VENGVEISCLKVQRENSHDKPHEVCINFASRDILSDEWQELLDQRRKEQYTDYFDFEGHRYPRKLDLLVNGIKVITANVGNLTTAAFDQRLLVAPNGALERRQCADMKHAIPIETPAPMYPPSALQNKLMGDTAVAITVLADGSVTDIQLVGSAGQSMDDATLQTLKSWKFKPATCGTEPVVSDIEVIVTFRLR